jgi:hypothetical protein
MNEHERRTPPADPTAERTADQSTQENSGLHGGIQGVRPGPGPEVARELEGAREEDEEDVLNRSAEERYETPRRYEGDEEDPTMPADDSTLNTKI